VWAVSDAFLRALTQSHTLTHSCTLTSPGSGTPLTLQLAGGTVAAQSGQIIRRTAALQVAGTSDVWQRLAVPGSVITLQHGIDFGGGTKELVPLIKGELSSAATDLGDGLISVNLADFGQRLQASAFLTAQSPAITAGRIATVIAAVQGAVPSATVTSTASDTGTIGTSNTWPSDRGAMITALLTDAGAEGFFRADGSYLIRDLPQVTNPVVWALKTGDGGTITALTRNRPLDKLYNTVIVQPANLDASQTWTQVIAQITDTNNPRHPNYIGVRPYVWQSPTILTLAQAQQVAGQLLTKLQGSTETLSLGAVSNPALEVGDVVRTTNPTDEGVAIAQHLIDSLSIDIATGAMTLATRAQQEVLA
jgi:hypothetical protein